MKEDWPTTPERKREVVEALMGIVRSGDPELTIEVAKVFEKADEVNLKRKLLDLKQQEVNESRRRNLIELARLIPPGELAKLASSHGVVIDSSGRENGTAGEDGKEAGN